MAAAEEKVVAGWAMPSNSKRFHFFNQSRSLCGAWGFFGTLEADNGKPDPEDCKKCRERFSKNASYYNSLNKPPDEKDGKTS